MDGDLAPDEVPPQSIWHHARRLTEWFAAVKHRRSTGQEKIEEPVEDAPMMKNQVLEDMGWTRD